MTQIIVLPHVELCPEGSVIEARPGQTICETLLENGIRLNPIGLYLRDFDWTAQL